MSRGTFSIISDIPTPDTHFPPLLTLAGGAGLGGEWGKEKQGWVWWGLEGGGWVGEGGIGEERLGERESEEGRGSSGHHSHPTRDPLGLK